MIKINFEVNTNVGIYKDALHLPEDHTFTDAEIETMKQQRVDNWLSIVDSLSAEEGLAKRFRNRP